VPFQKSLGTVVADRVFDLLVFALLFVLIIFLNKELITELDINQQFSTWICEKWTTVWGAKYFIICILLLLTAFMVVIFRRKTRQTNHIQSKIIDFFKKIISGLWQGLISVKDIKHPFLFIVYTVAIWVFYYLGTFLCMYAFNFLQGLGFMPAFIVLVVGAVGFMIAQGGLGAYPLFVAGTLVLFNVNYAQGLAAGWIGWAAQTVMILIVGFTSLILASFLKVENRAVNSD
jgi:MFS family permease